MAKTTTRVLGLLQTRRQWPGRDLAERLAVTERTLRRDIERLRELGYRVEATRGAAGGYRLEAGAELPPLLLTTDEAVTIAIGLRAAASHGLVDGEQLSLGALAKFEQVLPPAARARVTALSQTVRTTAPPRTSAVSIELLGGLALACRDRERIRFHYTAASGEETDRVVEPSDLVAAAHAWFLVCWDLQRDAWRTLRVDRISRIFHTRVQFEPRRLPAADAAQFVSAAVASAGADAHRADVILQMPIERVREHFGQWASAATAIDAEHSLWPLNSATTGAMLASLAWIPAGVEYEVRGSDEFLAVIAESSERMHRAARRPALRDNPAPMPQY